MKSFFIFLFLLTQQLVYAQVVVPKKGFGEINIGITYEDVIWILGFDGSRISKDSAPEMITAPANELGIRYDYVVNFKYIMDYPVTTVYFRENLAVMFTISSYPEYNQFICQDIETSVGLKFWDNLSRVKQLYGNSHKKLSFSEGNIEIYAYPESGISFGMDNDNLRTISIFDPEFK